MKKTAVRGWNMRSLRKHTVFLILIGLFGAFVNVPQASAAYSPLPVLIGAASPCKKVVWVGAEGSGQTYADWQGLGGQVREGLDAYATHMDGYTIGFYPVPYPAMAVPDVDVLLLVGAAREAYFSSIDFGVEETLSFLEFRYANCPTEHYVLAGYSQGAMVMHRTLAQLLNPWGEHAAMASSVLPRLDGVLAIADGDRVANQGGTNYGTAQLDGYGVSWAPVAESIGYAFPPMNGAVPSTTVWPAGRFHSVCDAGDVVCDVNHGDLTDGIRIHSYDYALGGDGVVFVDSAATNISKTTKALLSPLDIRGGEMPDAIAGSAYRQDLNTTILSGPQPSSWSLTAPLGSGWAVSPDGILTGSQSDAGLVNLEVTATDANGLSTRVKYFLRIGPRMRAGTRYEIQVGGVLDSAQDVTSVVWTSTPLPGATLTPGNWRWIIGTKLIWTPEAAGTYPFSVAVTYAGGTVAPYSGTAQVYPVPAPSLIISNLTAQYATTTDWPGAESFVSFTLSKNSPSDTTPNQTMSDAEDPTSDYYQYVSGDENLNGILDVGEAWLYTGHIPWGYSPSDTRTRTIQIRANDTTGATDFLETTLPVLMRKGPFWTTTTLTANPTSLEAGASTILTATVTDTSTGEAVTGNVQFFEGPTSLGTVALFGGLATKSVTVGAAGDHMYTAQFIGNSVSGADFRTSFSTSVTVTSAGGTPPIGTNAPSENSLDSSTASGATASCDSTTHMATLTVSSGAANGRTVNAFVYSTPTFLGQLVVSDAGTITVDVSTLSAGTHKLVIVDPVTGDVIAWGSFTKTDAAIDPSISKTMNADVASAASDPADGEFSIIDTSGSNVVDLTNPALVNGASVTSGALGAFQVTDLRQVSKQGWDLATTVSQFVKGTDTIENSALGITPKVISQAGTGGTAPVLGAATVPGSAVYPWTFASLAAGSFSGVTAFKADLVFTAPAAKTAGTYTSTLTLTLISK